MRILSRYVFREILSSALLGTLLATANCHIVRKRRATATDGQRGAAELIYATMK